MQFLMPCFAADVAKTASWLQWLDKNPLWVVLFLTILLFVLAQWIRPWFRDDEQEVSPPAVKARVEAKPLAPTKISPVPREKPTPVTPAPKPTVVTEPRKKEKEVRVEPAVAKPVAQEPKVAKPTPKPVTKEVAPVTKPVVETVVEPVVSGEAPVEVVVEKVEPKAEPVVVAEVEPVKPTPAKLDAEVVAKEEPVVVEKKTPAEVSPQPELPVKKAEVCPEQKQDKPKVQPVQPVVVPVAEPVVSKEQKKAPIEEVKVKPTPVVKPEEVKPVPQPVVVQKEPVAPQPVTDEDDEEARRRKRSEALKEKRRMTVDDLELQEETVQPRTLRDGLEKTRKGWLARLNDLVRGKKELDEELLEELEEVLYTADIGTRTTAQLLSVIEEKMERKELKSPDLVREAIKDEIYRILTVGTSELDFEKEKPYVVMVVGVNGVGKTTSIGKLAARFAYEGKQVVVAAADTFRAAAVEQLEQWASRVDAQIVKGQPNQDPSSVVFDAVQAGVARGVDIILADTAGRLHTKQNLMEELKKVKRVVGRAMTTAPHEVWLVLDATTGQNAINQAKQFHEALGVTGIVLTKLDGTAKGGVVVAIAEELKIPIRFIGVGEHIDELRRFSPAEFVDALF